ncbi:MAG: Copper-binding lipoprotein NosL [Pseudomonadales bacterium]|nr:Copper-binding lipoprotein NosL [Pseudomonadales bacterium]
MRRCFDVAAMVLAALLMAGCGEQVDVAAQGPHEIVEGTSCALDGMLLADYPGPKAQIHYIGRSEPDFFCDTIEMFNVYTNPEQVRAVRALYVQDMGSTGWDEPRGAWIDARTASYVVGSSRHGAMGPTIASFGERAAAERFAATYGGRVLAFDEISADMAVLDGGALHDHAM